MPWQGISEAIDAYGRMRVRVRAATAAAAVGGAQTIYDAARANILARFINRTFDLYNSMTYDRTATALGANSFSARAYPRGPSSSSGTPYGRIQELGGTIFPHNPTGLLWLNSLRDDGTWGVISVHEVTLEGRFYLRDATIASVGSGALHAGAKQHWLDAVEA